jgi:NAD(P)-dependent dehydrogenase (short-subunit alcohol dehydrogenase family)
LGLKPKFHQLDVTDQKSLEIFRDFIKNEHGGIDVLVNNAAIAYKVSNDIVKLNMVCSCHNVTNTKVRAEHRSVIV